MNLREIKREREREKNERRDRWAEGTDKRKEARDIEHKKRGIKCKIKRQKKDRGSN